MRTMEKTEDDDTPLGGLAHQSLSLYNTITMPATKLKTAKSAMHSREHSVTSSRAGTPHNNTKSLGLKSKSQVNLYGNNKEIKSYQQPLKRGHSYSQMRGNPSIRDNMAYVSV